MDKGKIPKKNRNKSTVRKTGKNIGGLLHESIKGHMSAFSTISPISALTNPAPTLKLQSRSKLSMTGGTNVSSLLMIQPNVFDSYATTTGLSNFYVSDGANQFNMTNCRAWPDAVFYNISSSSSYIGNTTATPSVLYSPGFSTQTSASSDEQEARIVSVGIRLQNRTVQQYRMPIAYIYHDFHGQLTSKIVGDNGMTHSELESYIVSSPHTITWDCTKDTVFEYTITRDDQDGTFFRTPEVPENASLSALKYLASKNIKTDYANYGNFNTVVGNWGTAAAGAYSVSNMPIISNPVVYVLFPGPASTSFINQYELTLVNHYEVKNHILEASGMLTPSLAAKGVAEVVNTVKQHKHRNAGKMLSTAVKPLCQKALREASVHIVDNASKLAVASAVAML